MGAWDESMDGNDSALDVIDDIKEYVKSGLTIRKAFNKYKAEVNMDIIHSSWHMLGLAHYQLKCLGKIYNDILRIALIMIEDEFERIGEWQEPEKRKKHYWSLEKK